LIIPNPVGVEYLKNNSKSPRIGGFRGQSDVVRYALLTHPTIGTRAKRQEAGGKKAYTTQAFSPFFTGGLFPCPLH